jgi:hypothetical protein
MMALDPPSEFDVERTGHRTPTWTSELVRGSGAAFVDVDAIGQCLQCYGWLWVAEIKQWNAQDFKWAFVRRLGRALGCDSMLIVEDRPNNKIKVTTGYGQFEARYNFSPEEYVRFLQDLRSRHMCPQSGFNG